MHGRARRRWTRSRRARTRMRRTRRFLKVTTLNRTRQWIPRPTYPQISQNVGASAARSQSREVVSVDDADALVSSMSSLSLVPPSIRFGRGGSRQAFPSGHRARVASLRGITTTSDHGESGLDGIEAEISSRGRGRGRGTTARSGAGRQSRTTCYRNGRS